MNRTSSLITLTALGSLLLPASGLAEATRHSGLLGGMTYGHFTYEGRHGGTEPGWGPTFGAFGELAPFPSDIFLLTIEGSYLRIGSGEEHYFAPAEVPYPLDASLTLQQTTHTALRESRGYLSLAPLLKITARSRISPYLQLGPTLNFRLPEGTSYPGTLVFGGVYGFGVAALHGRQSFMAEVRYLQHWSSSADDYTPASTARALSIVGRIGY